MKSKPENQKITWPAIVKRKKRERLSQEEIERKKATQSWTRARVHKSLDKKTEIMSLTYQKGNPIYTKKVSLLYLRLTKLPRNRRQWTGPSMIDIQPLGEEIVDVRSKGSEMLLVLAIKLTCILVFASGIWRNTAYAPVHDLEVRRW